MPDATPEPVLDPARDPRAAAELHAWRAAYAARLAAPDGWWAVAGLDWLDEAPARIGSAADADLRLPAGSPAHVATLTREGDAVRVAPAAPGLLWHEGRPLEDELRVDAAGARFAAGADPLAPTFAVLARGDRRGVRRYDPHQARARAAEGVGWFPLEPGWRLEARFEAATPDERLPIVNVLGDVVEAAVAGRLRFERDGHAHALVATWAGDALFVSFRDATNGTDTYGAGRYLQVAAPVAGHTVLDFHRATHPPCAHTPFATCPLPPLANRLPFAVPAGERHP
jgi:uncharacterized protein (DUF1684 family)